MISSLVIPTVQGNLQNHPNTELTLTSDYFGSTLDGGFVYTTANPSFELVVNNSGNSTIYGTEFEYITADLTYNSNYSSMFQIPVNHTSDIDLKYRTNSSAGLESWKTLDIRVDADKPFITHNSNFGQNPRYTQNQSIFVISESFPMIFMCEDYESGFNSMNISFENFSQSTNNPNFSLTSQILENNSNGTIISIYLQCYDNVNNSVSASVQVILDKQQPYIIANEIGSRYGDCVESGWRVNPVAYDNHTTVNAYTYIGTSWLPSPNSIGAVNSPIIIRAQDSAGLVSQNYTWNLTIDSEIPNVNASLDTNSLNVTSSDNCGIQYLEIQWESYSGQISGWNLYTTQNLSIPPQFVGNIVRAHISVFDVFNNHASVTTNWSNTVGSAPTSVVQFNGPNIANKINPQFSVLISPIGVSSYANYELQKNNQTVQIGNISSQVYVNQSFNHGDYVTLIVNTSNVFGAYSLSFYNYTVDNSNGHNIPILISGTHVNTPDLILGPSARLVPATASDDASGVGGSHAWCTSDGNNWFQSNNGASYPPNSVTGSVEPFVFACRSVDMLGNMGPITWMNGTVDLENPTVQMSPNPSVTIGLNNSITVNMSDSNGIQSAVLELEWSNGITSQTSTNSLGAQNWSSSLGQLFQGLTDGTVTANLIVTDNLGNIETISGISWNLNTSTPLVSVTLSGNYVGLFVTNDSTNFHINLPSGGWSGLWSNYTMEDDSGDNVASGNITSSSTIQPVDLIEGNLTLTITTGDSLGRIGVQSFVYTVDNSNGHSVVIEKFGNYSLVNGSEWNGVNSYFVISGFGDDPNGVGGIEAQCSYNQVSWFVVDGATNLYPSINQNSIQSVNITCKNVDLIGNYGPMISESLMIDSVPPEHTITPPVSSYISPNNQIEFSFSDNVGLNYTSIDVTWTNSTNSLSHNVVTHHEHFNLSLDQIWSHLSDGQVSLSVITYDSVGNFVESTQLNYFVNTSMPETTVNLNGNYYADFVPSNGFSIEIIPPTIGNSPGWTNYTLSHSNGTVVHSGNISQVTTLDICDTCDINSLENGWMYLNVTTGDILGREQPQFWQYAVDTNIQTSSIFNILGPNILIGNNLIIGPTTNITLSTINDDSGGVGPSHANCTTGDGNWFHLQSNDQIYLQYGVNGLVSFSISCKNVDLLGNIGPVYSLSGMIDSISPNVNYSILNNSLLSQNTVFDVNCYDENNCQLTSFNIKIQQGTTEFWNSFSISGQNSSIQISNLLNIIGNAYLEIYTEAVDSLGNTVNASLGGLLYVNTYPTISVQISSTHYNEYINDNLTIEFLPSLGWIPDITLTSNISHSLNNTPLFSGGINSSNAVLSFGNLSTGYVWINSTICDITNQCTSSTIRLTIDNNAPSAPQTFAFNQSVAHNDSLIFNMADTIQISSGQDLDSGTHLTTCIGPSGFVTSSENYFSITAQSIAVQNSWNNISCYSVDKLGNQGENIEFMIWLDSEIPSVSVNFNSLGGVITPTNWLNISCQDNFGVDQINIEVWSSQSLIFELNSTSQNVSIRYGDMQINNSEGFVHIQIKCFDSARNKLQISNSLEYLTKINSATITILGEVSNSDVYITNLTQFTISQPRTDVSHIYRLIVNGSFTDWTYTNQTQNSIDLTGLNDGEILRIEVMTYIHDTELTNSTITDPLLVDISGPIVQLSGNNQIANNSVIPLDSDDIGVGISHYIWSFDNGTSSTSPYLSDVLLSSSTSSTSWLSIHAVDRLGNQGGELAVSISRDLSEPVINVNSSNGNYFGLNSTINIDIFEDTGIKNSTIKINNQNGLASLIASNVSSFTIDYQTAPQWIFSYPVVQVEIIVESNSGYVKLHTLSIVPDDQLPYFTINSALSVNYSQHSTSNYSSVFVDSAPDVEDLCIQVGENQTDTLQSNCLTIIDGRVNINRLSGNYLMLISGEDYAGNYNTTMINLVHHSELPVITHTIAPIVRSGDLQYFNISNHFITTTSITWNGVVLPNNGVSFTTPSGNSVNNIIIKSTNILGLESSVSISVNLDNLGPSISVDFSNLMNNVDFGSNSNIEINVSDSQSPIDRIVFFLNYSSISCDLLYLPSVSNFSISGNLSTLFNSPTCPSLQLTNQPITLQIIALDALGNYHQYSASYNYHGAIQSPQWDSNLTLSSNGMVWASSKSDFTCNADSGTISPTYQIIWHGASGDIDVNRLGNISSSGLATCLVTDSFNNSANAVMNVSFDYSVPSLNVTWPADSYQNLIINSGTSGFTIVSQDNETSIRDTLYCIDYFNCEPDTISSGGIVNNLPISGNYTLSLKTTNFVGISTMKNISFIVDNQIPELTVSEISNTSINNNTIYIGAIAPVINIQITDDNCVTGGYLYSDGIQISISNYTNFTLPHNKSYLEIYALDCVGNFVSNNYSISQVYSITPPVVGIANQDVGKVLMNNNGFVHSGEFNLTLNYSHSIELSLACQPSIGVQCIVSSSSNQYQLNLVSNLTNGYVILEFFDEIGNQHLVQLNLSSDTFAGYCTPVENLIIDGQNMITSSNKNISKDCNDNLAGIKSLSWIIQGTEIPWNLNDDGYWESTVPNFNVIQLQIEDNVSNKLIETYNVIFDNSAPSLTVQSNDAVSFDEKITRSDGTLNLNCNDNIMANCFIEVSIFDNNTGLELISSVYNNAVEVILPVVTSNSVLKITIVTYDNLNNQNSSSYILDVDDNAPEFEIKSYTTASGQVLTNNVVSHDGIIRITNISLDTNLSKSENISLSCVDNSKSYQFAFSSYINLVNYNVTDCDEISIFVELSDHVGNIKSLTKTFKVDFLTPTAIFEFDGSCSWSTGFAIDMPSNCPINVVINDDSGALLGNYELVIKTTSGQVLNRTFIGLNYQFTMLGYSNQTLIVQISGQDTVGNIVKLNGETLFVKDDLNPVWEGIICAGNQICQMEYDAILSPTSDVIKIVNQQGRAPISNVNVTLIRGQDEVIYLESDIINSDSISEGNYLMYATISDQIGRTYYSSGTSFVYDTEAPEINILSGLSLGLLNETTILSCDFCELKWSVNDITLQNSTTSEGISSLYQGQYNLSTRYLGDGTINVTAIDAFYRESSIELDTVSILSTKIDVSDELIESEDVNVQCIEIEPMGETRQVKCLWTRQGTSVSTIPVKISLDIDLEELRDIQLFITKPGSSAEAYQVVDGQFTIPNIYAYHTSFEIELNDIFSRTNKINVRMIEHSQAWSQVEFSKSDLSEGDFNSNFSIILTPPENEQNYLLLYRGYVEITNLLQCSIQYQFAAYRSEDIDVSSNNCFVQPDGLEFYNNGSIKIDIIVNHSDVGNYLVDKFPNRPDNLFNLDNFRIILQYYDYLKLSDMTLESELYLSSDKITRSDDRAPTFDFEVNPSCPLSWDGDKKPNSDGFLQSDYTSPISSCAEAIDDEDGVERTIWQFDFISGGYSIDTQIDCQGTFFPKDWDFKSAIEDGICGKPSNDFPNGIFDVKITPLIVDKSQYNNQRDSFIITESGYPARKIKEVCDSEPDCPYIEFEVKSVTVSSELSPKAEVERTKDFIEASNSFTSSIFFKLFFGISILLLLFSIRKIQIALSTQKRLYEQEMLDRDEESAEEMAKREFSYNENRLVKVLAKFNIIDREKFLQFSFDFDVNNDGYISEEEFIQAALEYNKRGLNTISITNQKTV